MNQEVHVSFVEYKVPKHVHMVQSDTGRNISLIIDDYTVPEGLSACIEFRRPDGSLDEIPAVLNGNTISAEADLMLTAAGKVRAYARIDQSIPGGTEKVRSFPFYVIVQTKTSL